MLRSWSRWAPLTGLVSVFAVDREHPDLDYHKTPA
jgi:hypothetical protein